MHLISITITVKNVMLIHNFARMASYVMRSGIKLTVASNELNTASVVNATEGMSCLCRYTYTARDTDDNKSGPASPTNPSIADVTNMRLFSS